MPVVELSRDSAGRIDYGLMLNRLERELLSGGDADRVIRVLSQRKIWERLDPDSGCRWARLSQMAGLIEECLEILEYLNRAHPSHEQAWKERLELLRLLDRPGELARARAQAIAAVGEESVRRMLASESPDRASAADIPLIEAPPEADPAPEEEDPAERAIHKPFEEMRREETLLSLYMDLFSGREDAFARQWRDSKTGAGGYSPIRRPMQWDDIQDHLKGKRTYGIYLIRHDNTVRTGVIDIDLAPAYRGGSLSREDRQKVRSEGSYLLRRLLELSLKASMPCILEFSGGKGYHLWYPFETPAPARMARLSLTALAEKVKGDVKTFDIEIFPKQDQLAGKGYGNLVKLPLGIHRGTGKPSCFLLAKDRSLRGQLGYLQSVKRIEPSALESAETARQGKVIVHPRHEAWAAEYPELAELERKCSVLAQIIASCRQSRSMSIREEKILLGTIGHLPGAARLLHRMYSDLPEYNRPLLDYRITRIRGTPLGCKRIHSLMGDGEGGQPCRFDVKPESYAHPLLHLEGWSGGRATPASEKVQNLQDAIEALKLAIRQVQSFLPGSVE